jgi:hypothetical protein
MRKLSVLLFVICLVAAWADTLDFSDWSVKVTAIDKSANAEDSMPEIVARGMSLLRSGFYDENQTIADYLAFNPKPARKFDRVRPQVIKNATKYMSDGTVANQYEIQLTGQILQALMPPTGGGVPVGPLACPTCGQPWPEGRDVPPGVSLIPLEEATGGPAYTGVLIDARGVDMNTALFPKIVNEEGHVVYGPEFFVATYAAERGPAGYYNSTANALADDRVGYNPLRINAIRSAGKNNTVLVIANLDARRLHSSQENLKLLERCRVVILTD